MRRHIIRKYGSFNSKFVAALGLAVTLLWWSSSTADEVVPAHKASIVSIQKTTAAELPTQKSMMVTNFIESGDSHKNLVPTLCLDVDLGAHHLSMEDEVTLTGVSLGRVTHASVGKYAPNDEVNTCEGNSMMITTDLSNLDDMQNDLYTGSLNIIISTE